MHNKVWLTVVVLGWLALIAAAAIDSNGFTRVPQWARWEQQGGRP